jgi:hypothetical protein
MVFTNVWLSDGASGFAGVPLQQRYCLRLQLQVMPLALACICIAGMIGPVCRSWAILVLLVVMVFSFPPPIP